MGPVGLSGAVGAGGEGSRLVEAPSQAKSPTKPGKTYKTGNKGIGMGRWVTYARPSASYSRRNPSNSRRCACSSRWIAITMSWVTRSTPSQKSMIRW